METNLALIYIRNGKETVLPVKDIDHAVRLADAIAESDLLDDDCDYNTFDVFYFTTDEHGNRVFIEQWKDDDGIFFDEYLSDLIYGKEA